MSSNIDRPNKVLILMVLQSISYPKPTFLLVSTEKGEAMPVSYFILWDIVDPHTVSYPNPRPNPNPYPEP